MKPTLDEFTEALVEDWLNNHKKAGLPIQQKEEEDARIMLRTVAKSLMTILEHVRS